MIWAGARVDRLRKSDGRVDRPLRESIIGCPWRATEVKSTDGNTGRGALRAAPPCSCWVSKSRERVPFHSSERLSEPYKHTLANVADNLDNPQASIEAYIRPHELSSGTDSSIRHCSVASYLCHLQKIPLERSARRVLQRRWCLRSWL